MYASGLRQVATLRGPASRAARYAELLLGQSEEFRALWADHEIGVRPDAVKRFVHPEVGDLELHCQRLQDPQQSHSLLVYTAVPGSESYEKLQVLAVLGTHAVPEPAPAGRGDRQALPRARRLRDRRGARPPGDRAGTSPTDRSTTCLDGTPTSPSPTSPARAPSSPAAATASASASPGGSPSRAPSSSCRSATGSRAGPRRTWCGRPPPAPRSGCTTSTWPRSAPSPASGRRCGPRATRSTCWWPTRG